jgi:hypothetical protein
MTKTFKGRVALVRSTCAVHTKDLEKKTLPPDERSLISRRWDTALKEWRSKHFTLEQLAAERRAGRSRLLQFAADRRGIP